MRIPSRILHPSLLLLPKSEGQPPKEVRDAGLVVIQRWHPVSLGWWGWDGDGAWWGGCDAAASRPRRAPAQVWGLQGPEGTGSWVSPKITPQSFLGGSFSLFRPQQEVKKGVPRPPLPTLSGTAAASPRGHRARRAQMAGVRVGIMDFRLGG